jgi:ankyrin repeat protein
VKNAPEQIVLKLIEVYPDALRQPDEYGHILLAASPSTLNIKDNSENNILHIAFRAGSILPLASKLIVKAGLEMLQEKNILGETPIEGTNSGNLQVLVKQAETPEGFARLEAQVNAPPGPPKAPWKPPEVS